MDVNSDLSYHLLSYFEWRIYHGVGVVILMEWLRWRAEFRARIDFLAMCRGIYTRNRLYISLCLLSLEQSLLGGTNFPCREQGV